MEDAVATDPVDGECFAQGGGLGLDEGPGDGGFRFDGVEVVVGAGHYVKGAVDAGLLQSPGVGDVLVVGLAHECRKSCNRIGRAPAFFAS